MASIPRQSAAAARPRREAILETVRFAAQEFLRTGPWQDRLQEVLARLGQVTEVSRVYIFENEAGAEGSLCTSQRYEWAAPGIDPQIDKYYRYAFQSYKTLTNVS